MTPPLPTLSHVVLVSFNGLTIFVKWKVMGSFLVGEPGFPFSE